MQILELAIENSSPLISYSPFRDNTLSTPRLIDGWNLYYNSSGFASYQGEVGSGNSSRITSMDGAYFSLSWEGSGIRLLGNATLSSYSIKLDGVDVNPNTTSLPTRTLFDVANLKDGYHTIYLTARIPPDQTPRNSSMLVFDGAVVRTYAHGANSTFSQQHLDENSISYNGRWSFQHLASGQTFHNSTTGGDRASATFNGTAFILRGMTMPAAGNYSVTLDGISTTLCAQSLYTVPNTTLFLATGLNGSASHFVEVRNIGGSLSLLENGFGTYMTLSRPALPPISLAGASDTPLPGGTIASFALAGFLFAVIVIAGLFYYLIWRKRKRKQADLNWDDRRYMVYNRSPGNDGSVRKGFRFGRRTRTSVEIVSYGVKGDAPSVESAPWKGMSSGYGRNKFGVWQRDGDRNSLGISLPILYKHSASDVAVSGAELPEFKHPYSYDPTPRWERFGESKESQSLTPADMDLQSVALANLKNKGKARQITGATSAMENSPVASEKRLSWSPNLLQGLHMKISNGNSWSRVKTPPGSVSLSLDPSTSPTRGQGRRYRNSGTDRLSSFQAASNPSFQPQGRPLSSSPDSTEAPSLPSFPRSVSDSNSNTITPHTRQNSRHQLIDDLHEEPEQSADIDVRLPLSPPPHAYRNLGNTSSNLRQTIPSSSLRQAVRSLSPRISGADPDGHRYASPTIDHFYADILTEGHSILEEDKSMTAEMDSANAAVGDVPSSAQLADNALQSAGSLPPSPLSAAPSENLGEGQVEDDPVSRLRPNPILPSLKRASPFNIKFDWQFDRESVTHNSKQPRRASDSSRLRVPHRDSREDFVQGTSRSRFRLTPLSTTTTNNHPATYSPSQVSSEVVTSFLDFTGSSEGSSVRTNSLSVQSESRIFGSPALLGVPGVQGGRMAELRSRWSDTTASTRRRDSSSREGNLSSSSGDNRSSRRKKAHSTSLIPPPIYVTSEAHSPTAGPRETDSAQFSTENPLHVHPPISSSTDEAESHSDSPRSPQLAAETLLRSGDSDEFSGTNSRRTTDSSNQFHSRLIASRRYPPLPEGTDEELHPPS